MGEVGHRALQRVGLDTRQVIRACHRCACEALHIERLRGAFLSADEDAPAARTHRRASLACASSERYANVTPRGLDWSLIARGRGQMSGPESRFYESQGLRLHYADWGNAGAPPILLVHGGRDHCRSWDAIARALRPHFHVLAPDLRGHGDSDWAKGGSYSLTEYVYDLSRLVRHLGARQVAIIGHSMGGMVGLIFAGTFPEQVSSLVVLDGVTVMPDAKSAAAHERIASWVGQLDKLEAREPRRYRTIRSEERRVGK